LHLETQHKGLNIEVGGIWSGDNKVGLPFQYVLGSEGTYLQDYTVYQDTIEAKDAFGGKIKLMKSGRISWYIQAAIMGLVADGGPTAIQTFSDWWLKDSGKGNQKNIMAGFSTRFGNLEVAPNFLWQKPLQGPIPKFAVNSNSPAHFRNVRDDAFAVRENREMTAGELVITYDPTPATWMYQWDSDVQEDAKLAASLGIIFKHMPTTMDAALFFDSSAGQPIYAFPGATPARDIWEARLRVVSKLRTDFGLVTNFFAGQGEPNGDDPRLINRYGFDTRIITGSTKIQTVIKLNDWGPYDYHKDHNLTYPIQLMTDISTVSGIPEWLEMPRTRIGIKAIYRTLDQYSPRYSPRMIPGPDDEMFFDPTDGNGNEWEIRTYLHFNVGM